MTITSKRLIQDISNYLHRQLLNSFSYGEKLTEEQLFSATDYSLKKLEKCFKHINSPYYLGNFRDKFNPLNGDHWVMFLYHASYYAFHQEGNETIATKIFLNNKMLHGIDLFYTVNLPDIFVLGHPVGTVLGKAQYGNFFCAYQGCTVGSIKGEYAYPLIGEHVTLYANTTIIGKLSIGNHVTFGANSFLIKKDIPDDTTVLGQYPQNTLLKREPGKNDIFLY